MSQQTQTTTQPEQVRQFKVHFPNDDIRRFALSNVSYATVVSQIGNVISEPFVIKYLDDEKDLVTLSSDAELTHALSLSSGNNVLRLTVTKKVVEVVAAKPQKPKKDREATKQEGETKQGGGRWKMARLVSSTPQDNILLPPTTEFTKTFRFRNESEQAWPAGTVFLNVGKLSDQLSAESTIVQSLAKPGEEVDVSLQLKTPAKAGEYNGFWRLAGPLGGKFGQRVRVAVRVFEENSEDTSSSSSSSESSEQKTTTTSKTGDEKLLLGQLQEMGFGNNALNLFVLSKCKMNLTKAVQKLNKLQQKQMIKALKVQAKEQIKAQKQEIKEQAKVQHQQLKIAKQQVKQQVKQ